MARGKKTGGRAAGTPNKATADIKSRIAALIDSRFDAINEALDQLDPKDKVSLYLKFLEYVLPKKREDRIDISGLSDTEIDALLNKALSKMNHEEN